MAPRKLPKGPPAEVEIAYLLTRLGGRQATAFAELLRPLDLRPKQFAILNLIALNDGPSQQQLGGFMELDPSGLISTIDELEQRGWLERRRDPADRRRHALYLTAAGTAKLSEGRTAALARAKALTSPLSAAERGTLLELLRRLS